MVWTHLTRYGSPLLLGGLLALTHCSSASSGASNHAGQGGSGATSGAGGNGGAIIDDDGGVKPKVGVPQTCAEAELNQSYIGCEYWPTVTSNAVLYSTFEFAIVVTNPTKSPAEVTVERGGKVVVQGTIAPGQLQTIPLPWVPELKQDATGPNSMTSVLAKGGAYKVTSSVPITVYQFNPLEFQLPVTPLDCPNAALLGGCYSFTNDASLLLPKTALRGEYYVMAAPTLHLGQGGIAAGWSDAPGFVAITATEDNTAVTFTAAGNVRPGVGVGAMAPGQSANFTLNAGDVLMLDTGIPPAAETPLPGKPCSQEFAGAGIVTKCPSAPEYDLTGSKIVADKPVSVIGGHDCTFMPYDRFACDHLEESLFPIEALGQDLMVTAPHAVAAIDKNPGAPDFMFVRVLSATEDNAITFDPPVHAPVTLGAGEWIEIGPINQDFHVLADNKIMVTQFMVGENFSGESAGAGDPAQSIAIPSEQYRLEYSFLAPTTYTHNFVNIVAPADANITIDGTPIPTSEFKQIGGSEFGVTRHKIPGGPHVMKGEKNFGIVVYGYGSYTSYMYPGGLNLETVVIQPK